MRSYSVCLAAIAALAIQGCGMQAPTNAETHLEVGGTDHGSTGGVSGEGESTDFCAIVDCAGGTLGGVDSGIGLYLPPPDFTVDPGCSLISPIGLSGVLPGSYGTTTAVLFIDLYEAGFEESDATVVWMFGDGALVPGGVAESHLYPGDGIYDVTVTVQSESREVPFDAVLTIEGQIASLADEACPNTVFCDLLDCENGDLDDPCLDNDPIPACP